jgi:hypothetical protein
MEIGGRLAIEAFRAMRIPSPRCGGGSGWGAIKCVIAFSEYALPLNPLPPGAGEGTRDS